MFSRSLLPVADSREVWLQSFLVDSKDFEQERVEFHQREGSHANMLSQRYIQSFQKTLKAVLQLRGPYTLCSNFDFFNINRGNSSAISYSSGIIQYTLIVPLICQCSPSIG